MSRKPIEQEGAGKLSPRERVWTAVRSLRTFTLLELQDATDPLVWWKTVASYADWLRKAGYIEPFAPQGRRKRGFDAVKYRLLKDSFEAPRVTRSGTAVTQGTATLAMWRTIIVLGEFDWHDVQVAASAPGTSVTPFAAKTYINLLNKAGYFRCVRESKPGTAARFRLIKNTGAHAPAVTRNKAVFDRNTGQFTWQQSSQPGNC